MAAPHAATLFPDRGRIDGSEIRFRAVCALGWALGRRFGELRAICDSLDPSLDAFYWIDRIEAAIGRFSSRDAKAWPADLSRALRTLAIEPEVRPIAEVVRFLRSLAADVRQPEALDPVAQFAALSSRGLNLAAQFIADPDWPASPGPEWNAKSPAVCVFVEVQEGNFQPATVREENRIDVRVNTAAFELKNALLFYLTLEFQMMHEYVSHFLPVWNSGNAFEEEFLLAAMFLYYRDNGPRGGLVSLVHEADERRADRHYKRRRFIQDELAPGQERELSRLLITLALLDEAAMKKEEKRHLLALLRKAPLEEDPALRKAIRSWIAAGDPPALYAKLRQSLSE